MSFASLQRGVAIALFNRGAAAAKMTVRWADFGIKNDPKVRDLWAHTDINAATDFSAEVPSHGVVMLRIK